MDQDEALYIISVAARMVGMHAQTLRKYERSGFLLPSRTDGRLRLYSREDLRRLRQIKRLVEDRGVNLAGVELALYISSELRALLYELYELEQVQYQDQARLQEERHPEESDERGQSRRSQESKIAIRERIRRILYALGDDIAG